MENATALPDLNQMILLWNSCPMILWWSAQSNASSLRSRLYCVYAWPVRSGPSMRPSYSRPMRAPRQSRRHSRRCAAMLPSSLVKELKNFPAHTRGSRCSPCKPIAWTRTVTRDQVYMQRPLKFTNSQGSFAKRTSPSWGGR